MSCDNAELTFMSRLDHSDTALTQRPALNGVFGENLAVQLESGGRCSVSSLGWPL